MSNPYTPPSTQEEHPGTPASDKHTTLRRIGALAMSIPLIRGFWSIFSNLDQLRGPTIIGAVVSTIFLGFIIFGFLRGGRKSHLAIAIILGLSIASAAFSLWYVTPDLESGDMNSWLTFAIRLSPSIIAFICATTLYVRATRTSTHAA